jgi:lysyl-tRNA synthetase class 2
MGPQVRSRRGDDRSATPGDGVKREVCGRVLDVRVTGADVTLVVLVDAAVRCIAAPSLAAAPAPGTLVRVELDDVGRVSGLEQVSSPGAAWDALGDSTRWSRVVDGTSRADVLWRRQDILRALRDDLREHGFLEVETPLLVPGTCPDLAVESVETTCRHYLVTSTEYQLKRLLVGGFERLFSLTRNFRAGDRGAVHSVEFTMLEWARAWRRLDDIEDDAERLVRRAFHASGAAGDSVPSGGHRVVIDGERWERVTLREALRSHLGVLVDETFSLPSIVAGADRAGLALPPSFRSDAHFATSFLLGELGPHLGHPLPTFLRAWPAFLTSSAALDDENPALAARSELYIGGVEIADGFPFLRDPVAQRASFERENQGRTRSGRRAVRLDERYVDALAQGIPPGAGMAMGVDRLVMALTGQSDIGAVQAFSEQEL